MPAAALARIIAPLALLAVIVTMAVVLGSGGGAGGEPTPPAGTTTTERRTSERRTYRVRPGDALSEIAQRYDLTVQDIVDLNPDIDPQALQSGQRLRLRR